MSISLLQYGQIIFDLTLFFWFIVLVRIVFNLEKIVFEHEYRLTKLSLRFDDIYHSMIVDLTENKKGF